MGEMTGASRYCRIQRARASCGGMDDGRSDCGEGPFRVSLSGGSTPKTLYTLLASEAFRERFPWHRVSWYWGDERFVPHDHPDSNYRMTREAMLAKAPVPPENIHPVPADGTPDDAAARYRSTLQAAYGATVLDPARPLFDVTLLGLGRRWPYRVAAAGRAGAAGTQALGCRRVPWPARGPHHHDLSGDREQPARRLSGGGQGEGVDLSGDPHRRQPSTGRPRQARRRALWFVDRGAGEKVSRTGPRIRQRPCSSRACQPRRCRSS